MAIHKYEGSGPPSAAPLNVGDHYTDTTNNKTYISVHTTDATGWQEVGSGSGTAGFSSPYSGLISPLNATSDPEIVFLSVPDDTPNTNLRYEIHINSNTVTPWSLVLKMDRLGLSESNISANPNISRNVFTYSVLVRILDPATFTGSFPSEIRLGIAGHSLDNSQGIQTGWSGKEGLFRYVDHTTSTTQVQALGTAAQVTLETGIPSTTYGKEYVFRVSYLADALDTINSVAGPYSWYNIATTGTVVTPRDYVVELLNIRDVANTGGGGGGY